jgi:hypothetical protein
VTKQLGETLDYKLSASKHVDTTVVKNFLGIAHFFSIT